MTGTPFRLERIHHNNKLRLIHSSGQYIIAMSPLRTRGNKKGHPEAAP
nr:MAG TPA: hypothetical protein [Caudoviricetes sp.]